MKYVPLKTILNRIPRTILREANTDDLLSHALDGLRMLNMAQRFTNDVKVFEIKNHKADLPPELRYIQLVAAMTTNPTTDELSAFLCDQVGTCSSCNYDLCGNPGIYWTEDKAYCDNCSGCVTEAEEYATRNYNICRPSLNYKLWFDSQVYNNNFQPLKFVGNARGVLCKDCPNKQCDNCYSTFSYDPETHQLVFPEMSSGFVCVAYSTEIKNEDGDFLIPDNSKLIEALAKWAINKHWEERVYAHEQGAMQIWMELKIQAQLAMKAARGSLLLSGINHEEIRQISFDGRYVSQMLKLPNLYYQTNNY